MTLVGSIANYCDPNTWPSVEEVRFLREQGIGVTIGIHPKVAHTITPQLMNKFQEMVQWPEVVGVGEVRLDRTVKADHWSTQQDVLGDVLRHLSERHVLVLHCRGLQNKDSSEAYQLRGSVPREQRIHLHCFNGTSRVVERWLEQFPRTMFGFTLLAENS